MVPYISFSYLNAGSKLLTNLISTLNISKHIHTTAALRLFHEKDRKGGDKYLSKGQQPTKTELIRDGLKELKKEIILWQKEVQDKFESDPIIIYRSEEVDRVWQLNSPEQLSQWVTTSDSDHGEGYSNCELVMSPSGKGLFHGNLVTRVPKDGRIKKSGYCNVKSIRAKKSFKRETFHDWSPYNHLVLRVRGDGRSYLLNISTSGYFDITWFDIHHYILHTRGGPYWQVAKIPFSKFFLASKGRVQDKQQSIPLNQVVSFGISAGDKINGPFNLEIDYIGLEFDSSHDEEFAYEMYRTDKYTVAT